MDYELNTSFSSYNIGDCRTIPPIDCQDVPYFFPIHKLQPSSHGGISQPWRDFPPFGVSSLVRWADVTVGDILIIEGDGTFPADLLPLASSSQTGGCDSDWPGFEKVMSAINFLGNPPGNLIYIYYGKEFREYCLFFEGGAMNVHRPKAMWTLPTWMVRAI